LGIAAAQQNGGSIDPPARKRGEAPSGLQLFKGCANARSFHKCPV
jgi:hypothetical protein